MFQIQYKGMAVNLDLDTTNFTGDTEHDAALSYVTRLVAGKIVALDSNGKVQIADGDPANELLPVGFLMQDAAGYFMQNKPAIAGKKVAATFGVYGLLTDQIDTALTFAPGQLLYCGTGAKAGLVTNVKPAATALSIGVAGSAASAASPTLLVLAK